MKAKSINALRAVLDWALLLFLFMSETAFAKALISLRTPTDGKRL